MMAVPAVTPVTVPPMILALALLLAHAPPMVVLLSVIVAASQTLFDPLMPPTVGKGLTVTANVAMPQGIV